MNRNHLAVLSVLALTAAPLWAQEGPPSPPKQLDKLKVFAGHWQGAGTAVMQPGAPASKWTCESTYAWVLDNFWLQCDTSIVFEGMPEAMRFREYMGWDNETQRYVSLAVNNMGEGVLAPLTFPADDTMVLACSRMTGGQPQLERSVTKFGKDDISFAITFVNGAEPAAEAVKGTMKRVTKATPVALDASHAFMPAAPEMAKIARMTGDFDVTGSMVMMPGSPPSKIQGRDSVHPLFDGAVLQVVTTGTAEGMPGKYEAHVFYCWNGAESCYAGLMVSNMGEVGQTQARFVGDDKFVATFAGTMMGAPMVNHTVLELDGLGHARRIVSYCISGTSAPYESFRGDYKPAK